MGKTGQQLCPMSTILPYVAVRGADPGPQFRFADGAFLTRERFVSEVRQRLIAAKINPAPYSSHSFRIGAATTAARAGMDATMIQTLGRWKSAAYELYIQIPRESLAAVSAVIAAVQYTRPYSLSHVITQSPSIVYLHPHGDICWLRACSPKSCWGLVLKHIRFLIAGGNR